MNFLEEIKQIALKTAPKWKILTEDFKVEMEEMQKYQIPISDQITLIVKHTGIERMTESELRQIIKKYFKKSTATVTVENKSNKPTLNNTLPTPTQQSTTPQIKPVAPTPPPKRATDILEEDFDLRNFQK